MTILERTLAVLRRNPRLSEAEVPHDAISMVFEVGKAREALLYSLLFLPELSVVDDSILLTNGSSDVEKRFLEAKRRSQRPLDRIEASFNLVEVPFLFADEDFSDEEEKLLAEKIAEAWRRALAAFCPDRRMVVSIIPAEENAGNISVEFFEHRSAADQSA